MNYLKNCFFSISDGSIPYLYDLMEELDNNGVRLFTLDPAVTLPTLMIPEGSYTITDNETGVEFARKYDTGYVLYMNPSSVTFGDSFSQREKPLSMHDAQCVIEGFDEVTADFIEKMYQRKIEIPWTILVTPRTIVREISLNDIDELFELYEDAEIKRFIPPLLPTKEEELDFQREYIKKMYGFFGYGFWNVLDRESSKLIGRAGLTNRDGFDDMELGYLFKKEYRRQGIGTEVCRSIMDYAREILGAERLNAFIRPDNSASVSFAEKLGFVYSGDDILSEGKTLGRYCLKMQ